MDLNGGVYTSPKKEEKKQGRAGHVDCLFAGNPRDPLLPVFVPIHVVKVFKGKKRGGKKTVSYETNISSGPLCEASA